MKMITDNIDKFRVYLTEQEKSNNTIISYVCAVAQFYSFIGSDKITKDKLISYKSQILKEYKPASVNAKICALNEYLRFINSNQSLKYIKIYKKISAENIITLAEYRVIRDGLLADEKYKHYFLVRFLAETGCRVNELVQFRVEHVRQGYAELFTKGKVRRIYIPIRLQIDAIKWLSRNNKLRGYIFTNGSNSAITGNGVFKLLQSFAKRYNIAYEVVHPHSFRHMFAIEFLKRDNDISLLSDLLEHENISTTSIYLKLSSDEQRNRISQAVDW